MSFPQTKNQKFAIIDPSPLCPRLYLYESFPDDLHLQYICNEHLALGNLLSKYSALYPVDYLVPYLVKLLQQHNCTRIYIISLGGIDHILLHMDLKKHIKATYYSLLMMDGKKEIAIKQFVPRITYNDDE